MKKSFITLGVVCLAIYTLTYTLSNTSHTVDHSSHSMEIRDERTFIEHMIPHHEEAISTAQEVLARGGTTSEIRELAGAIISAQEKEVVAMKEWYLAWYDTPYTPSDSYTSMMRDLGELSGTSLDISFLEDMILHHQGAIDTARNIQPFITHAEMTKLTDAIIFTQTEEINLITNILDAMR